jgi:hypothetical protein
MYIALIKPRRLAACFSASWPAAAVGAGLYSAI